MAAPVPAVRGVAGLPPPLIRRAWASDSLLLPEPLARPAAAAPPLPANPPSHPLTHPPHLQRGQHLPARVVEQRGVEGRVHDAAEALKLPAGVYKGALV